METVEVVEDRHVEGRRGRSLFLVAANVQSAVVGPPIGQPMDEPGVAVVGEDDRLVFREEEIEVLVAEPMGMLAAGLQIHQVHHVDHPHLQLRE